MPYDRYLPGEIMFLDTTDVAESLTWDPDLFQMRSRLLDLGRTFGWPQPACWVTATALQWLAALTGNCSSGRTAAPTRRCQVAGPLSAATSVASLVARPGKRVEGLARGPDGVGRGCLTRLKAKLRDFGAAHTPGRFRRVGGYGGQGSRSGAPACPRPRPRAGDQA